MRGVEALAMLHCGTPHLGGGHWPLTWGRVDLWDAEFSLAQRSSGVTGAVERSAEF